MKREGNLQALESGKIFSLYSLPPLAFFIIEHNANRKQRSARGKPRSQQLRAQGKRMGKVLLPRKLNLHFALTTFAFNLKLFVPV
jgi:hypothetical protein